MLDLDYHSWSKVVEGAKPIIRGLLFGECVNMSRIEFFLEYYVDTWHKIVCEVEE
jgi:hypothetical protein